MESARKRSSHKINPKLYRMKRDIERAVDYLYGQIDRNRNEIQIILKILRSQVKEYREYHPSTLSPERDLDLRSVFIYNIERDATPGELKEHMEQCGFVENVTMLYDEHLESRGMAYVEFEDETFANMALCMTKSLFMGQAIRIVPRNLNVQLPIMQATVQAWGSKLAMIFPMSAHIKKLQGLVNAIGRRLNAIMKLYIRASADNLKAPALMKLLLEWKTIKRSVSDDVCLQKECDEKLEGNVPLPP